MVLEGLSQLKSLCKMDCIKKVTLTDISNWCNGLYARTEFKGGGRDMLPQHLDRGAHDIFCPPNILW